jgi:O-succinylbenzoate synthase
MRCVFAYRRYGLAFRQPLRTAHGLWAEREGIIVQLSSETGTTGWGEAAPVPGFGMETVDALESACRALNGEVSEASLSQLPAELPTLHNALREAWTAATGKSADSPADDDGVLKRPAVPPASLPVAALLPAGRVVLEVAPARVDSGFRHFKWKVGVGDAADELALLDDLCAVLPAGSKLRLDANGAWDRRAASRWLERCADRPIEHLEQPIARDARHCVDTLFGLAADFPTPIALDESLVGEGDLEQWLGAGWPGVYVFKPALFADPGRALARLAAAPAAAVVFSSALETAIGAGAALARAFAWTGDRKALGFGVYPLFARPAFDGPATAPFVRQADVERRNPGAVWNALN